MSTAATGARHGRAIVEAQCVIAHFATKSVFWHYDEKTQTRIPRSRSEDVFYGCFDGIGLLRDASGMLCAQFTSAHRGAMSWRRRKIESEFLKRFDPRNALVRSKLDDTVAVELWGWVNRVGFKRERFSWRLWTWQKIREPLVSPLTKSGRSAYPLGVDVFFPDREGG